MKREIFCHACGMSVGRAMPFKQVSALDAEMSKLEKVVKVYGKLLVAASCDFCNHPLVKGDEACCQSIVAMGQQYFPWEHEYMEPAKTSMAAF